MTLVQMIHCDGAKCTKRFSLESLKNWDTAETHGWTRYETSIFAYPTPLPRVIEHLLKGQKHYCPSCSKTKYTRCSSERRRRG